MKKVHEWRENTIFFGCFSFSSFTLFSILLCDDISDVKWRKAKHMVLQCSLFHHSFLFFLTFALLCFAWKHVNSTRNFIRIFLSLKTFFYSKTHNLQLTDKENLLIVIFHYKWLNTETLWHNTQHIWQKYEFLDEFKSEKSSIFREFRVLWVKTTTSWWGW